MTNTGDATATGRWRTAEASDAATHRALQRGSQPDRRPWCSGLVRVLLIVTAFAIAAVMPVSSTASSTLASGDASACVKPENVQNISFSKTKYPEIRRHFLRALRKGWPRTLVLNRRGAEARRERLLTGVPTKHGYDRDEYPPAVGRGNGPGLDRGTNPRGWRADVAYVPSSENRSHGSTMGLKLRRFCSGTQFRYVFY